MKKQLRRKKFMVKNSVNESKVKPENFYVVHGWMIRELNVNRIELDIYAIIFGFSQEENCAFRGSLRYLADWAKCSRRAVIYNLQSLEKKGYIKKKEYFNNGVKLCEYYATKTRNEKSAPSAPGVVQEMHQGSANDAKKVVQEMHQGGANDAPNNIEDNIDINNKEKEIYKEKETPSFSLCVFDSDFSKFWSEYPRKEKKDRAKKAFLKKRKAGLEFNTILDGLERHKQKWAQENTKLKYIPHPASWINDERWNDEIVISKNEGESGYNINSYEQTMDVFDVQVKKEEEEKKKQEQEQAKLKEIIARDHDKNVERYGKQFAEDLETSESIEDYYDFVNDYERRMSKGLLPNGDYPPELSYLENNLFESPEERARAIEYALSGAHRL